MKFWTVLLACVLAFASVQADAAQRLGNGRSVGQASGPVTQREATQQAPAAQGKAQASQAAAAAPAAPRRSFGALVGAVAAGLGLAWLAQALGLGAGFAQFLLFALLALVIMVVVGFVMRARRSGAGAVGRGLAFAGASAEHAATPRQYSPDKVGNDASARPWEQPAAAFDAARAGGQPDALDRTVPAGFDARGFVEKAKRNFVVLQDAWDRADMATLRAMMTDEMLGEIRTQLAERERQHGGPQTNKTEVVMLQARLLGIEDRDQAYLASVEFTGMLREEPSAGPGPFREVWAMTKPKDGSSGWLVAGVQALQ